MQGSDEGEANTSGCITELATVSKETQFLGHVGHPWRNDEIIATRNYLLEERRMRNLSTDSLLSFFSHWMEFASQTHQPFWFGLHLWTLWVQPG